MKKLGWFKKDICLIYTMGKVGSSSLEQAIPHSVHTHSLYMNPPNPLHWTLRHPSCLHKVKAYIRSKLNLIALRTCHQVKIISVVRDPMDRNISMFFQALPFWLAQGQSVPRSKPTIDSREEGFDTLINCFNKVFNHSYPDSWFDQEIKKLTGIDVLAEGFDKVLGNTTYTRGKYKLLVVRVDKLQASKNTIEGFLNQKMKLEDVNSGQRKWYADIYNVFKRDYQPPEHIAQKVYQSRFYKAFFD